MNDPLENSGAENVRGAFNQAQASATSLLHHVEEMIRDHPVAAALATLGLGCAIGVAAREMLQPPQAPAKDRALGLLEDIQDRLAELVEPISDRVSDLADEGVSAVKSGLHSASKSQAGNRIRKWFS